jgi:Holliday junction resolvase RusA-like endonuclease
METAETIKLVIPGEPKAQQRHRSVLRIRKGCHGVNVELKNGKVVKLYEKDNFFIQMYDPSYKDKKEIARMLRLLAPKKMLEGPLRVDCYFYFSYLNNHYGTGRNAGRLKITAPAWKDTGKDRDNCDKLILDVLTGMFFKNDSQICAGIIIKQYSELPRTEVYITPLELEIGTDEISEDLNLQQAAAIKSKEKIGSLFI